MDDHFDDDNGFCDAGDHSDDYDAIFGQPLLHERSSTWAFCARHRDQALADVADQAKEAGMSYEAAMRRVIEEYGGDSDASFLQGRLHDLPRDGSINLVKWQEQEISELDAFCWVAAGEFDPEVVYDKLFAYLAADTALTWKQRHEISPAEAVRWRAVGVTDPALARALRDRSVSPEQAAPVLKAAHDNLRRALAELPK